MARYYVLDVFTDTAFAGNALAVVMDADGMSDARMQAVAREFNLSETVFVEPAASEGHRAAIRIFTPVHELPFAGHPTVGTAVLLALLDKEEDGEEDRLIVLEEKVGPVRVGVRLGENSAYAEFDIPKLPEAIDFRDDRSALASAVGLMPNEIGFENHRPSAFSAGVPYVFIPVRDVEALARSTPVVALFRSTFPGKPGVYAYTRTGDGYAARMFDPLAGIVEDPATGSAAAGFAGVIRRFDALKDGSHEVIVHQGREMGRPSRIDLELTLEAGALKRVRVGGEAVLVARGELLD